MAFDVRERCRDAIHALSLLSLFLYVYSVRHQEVHPRSTRKICLVRGGAVIRFQIEQRRPINAIEAAYPNRSALNPEQLDER